MTRIACIRDDGGRAAAGFMPSGGVDDCVTRAIAIATETPYAEVHAELGRLAGNRRAPDIGLEHEISAKYLEARGWLDVANQLPGPDGTWHATMYDLPPGRYVLICRDTEGNGHFMAFITDGERGELRDVDGRLGRSRLEDWLPHPVSGWWTRELRPLSEFGRRASRCPPPPPRKRRRRR